MSDSCQEQRPLLCDDCLDEELHIENYRYQRRFRPSFRSGRARYHAKGAAAIIAHWPNNCSTSVAYWWLGVIMIAVTVFVIYNCVLVFGMVSKPNEKPPEYRFFNNVIKPPTKLHILPDVFMHLIVNNNTDMHLNKHLPLINLLSQRHPNYKYTLLVLINDTFKDVEDFNDDKRNTVALDSLWTHKSNFDNKNKEQNVSVEFLSLTTYLNESPIKKFWRNLPSHIIHFLVRSVSVWDKGGISFNPLILTSETPNQKYSEILYDLLKEYGKPRSILKSKSVTKVSTNNKRRPNNIQDIINSLNKEDNNILQNDLNVADNNEVITMLNTKENLRKRRFTIKKHDSNNKNNQSTNGNKKIKKDDNISDSANHTKFNEITIPFFLKHFFYGYPNKDFAQNVSNLNSSKEFKRAQPPLDTMTRHNKTMEIKKNSSEEFFNLLNLESKIVNTPELSIDIKGNIIASKTACHAFLGTIYSNVYRHTEEKTVTDFIISELSYFCNGLISSCEGINVILV